MRNIAGLKPTNRVFGYILYALFVIGCAAVLLGCGADEITGTGGNPPASEQLIYLLDSFSLWSPAVGVQQIIMNDTIPVAFDSCRITFESTSNCDTTATIQYRAIDSTVMSFIGIYHHFNTTHTAYKKAITSTYKQRLELSLRINNQSSGLKYLVVKNFKVYKIK